MLVKAKTSFAGIVTMHGGEERDIKDEQVVKDLLACGYVTLLEDDKSNAASSAVSDDSANVGDESHDDESDSLSGNSDDSKQKGTKDENKRAAR